MPSFAFTRWFARPAGSGRARRTALAFGALGLLGALIGTLAIATAQNSPGQNVTPRAAVTAAPRPATATTRPLWRELSPAQQHALAPLRSEWDRLERSRKLKWIEIATLFPRMKPEEQQRTQERMREWARLSPEARRVARDSYMRVQTLPPEKRAELLQQYQQLPDAKKRQLEAQSRAQKTLTPAKPLSRQGPAQAVPSKAQIRQGVQAGNPATVRPPVAAPAAPAAPLDASPALPAMAAPETAAPTATSAASGTSLPAAPPASTTVPAQTAPRL